MRQPDGSTTLDFDELARYRPKLERVLARQYADERRRAGVKFAEEIALLREFTLRGGKRFRSLFLLAGYYLATGRDPSTVLEAAAGLEHFQSWMLIHDDIIDHSEVRRGGPSVHRALEERFRNRSGLGVAEAYGQGLGITLGDLEEPLTVRSLLRAKVPGPRILRAVAEYVAMTRLTACGQILDIRNGSVPVDEVTEEDVLTVHRLKSAVYTVASPLKLGAILGGARPGLIRELEQFGLDAGIAFQLRDDVLGAGLTTGSIGKSANDLVEGKRTLLVVRAWGRADVPDRAKLTRVLGNPSASSEDIAAAQEIVRTTGALAHSEALIETLSRRALERVRRSKNLRPDGRALLGEVADRLVRRSL
ncbi:MAG: polyprenyl synthetase family protein [Thermoplasmata archaeon]|nr:polyprenyl synthetase family protein [Thermoplasmata archaeon]